jgi:hypothetical protein
MLNVNVSKYRIMAKENATTLTLLKK